MKQSIKINLIMDLMKIKTLLRICLKQRPHMKICFTLIEVLLNKMMIINNNMFKIKNKKYIKILMNLNNPKRTYLLIFLSKMNPTKILFLKKRCNNHSQIIKQKLLVFIPLLQVNTNFLLKNLMLHHFIHKLL